MRTAEEIASAIKFLVSEEAAFITGHVLDVNGGVYVNPAFSYPGSMGLPERLVVDPEVLSGKPVIRGSRISVELILDLLATGMPESEILENYPGIEHADVLACLAYASQLAHEWKTLPLSA
jgi:uncharacterized protein (DUF433 family)